MDKPQVAPPGSSGEPGTFEIRNDERDSLVRHALSVIGTAGEEASERDPAHPRRVEGAAKHTAVMVALLDQLGWSTARSIPGTYTLREELLPIEQVRVWVSERFRAEDLGVVDDAVRGLWDDLEGALTNYSVTCRLLRRLNARADDRRRNAGLAKPTEIFAPIDPAAAADVRAPIGRSGS